MVGIPKIPPKALAATALALALGFLLGQTCRPRPPADTRAWERRVSTLLSDSARVAKTVTVLQDSTRRLTARADTLERAVVRWEARAEVHRQRAQSARHALETAQTAADSLPAAIAALEATERVVVDLTVALDSAKAATGRLREATRLATARGDSLQVRVTVLEGVLADRPTPDRCKILWMDCPSRGAALVAGYVLGAASVVGLAVAVP